MTDDELTELCAALEAEAERVRKAGSNPWATTSRYSTLADEAYGIQRAVKFIKEWHAKRAER